MTDYLKSRSLRRVFKKLPGGRLSKHYVERKPSKPKCSSCGIVLKGIPHLLKSKFNALPKSRKRPERPYGGVMCSKCSRLYISRNVRMGK